MKPIKIPMTLERVGSEGKFFTDNMILKVIGSIILALVLSLIVLSQVSYMMPELWAFILALVSFVIQVPIYIRKLALQERQLKKLLVKMVEHERTNTNQFYDIEDYIDEVALHNSGHSSVFVEVVRGSTLGMSNDEAKEYYKCIQNFKNRILQHGYTYKEVNYETDDLEEEKDIMREQVNGARAISSNLAQNLEIKYKYTQKFMLMSVRKERWIFIITGVEPDTRQMLARVKQLKNVLNNYHIQEVKILTRNEVTAFAREYDDTRMFDTDLNLEDLKDILQFH